MEKVFALTSYLTEVDKSILLNSIAGVVGGLLMCAVEDAFDRFFNKKQLSFNTRLKRYLFLSVSSGIMVGLGVFVIFIFDNVTPIKIINQTFVPGIIIFFPFIGISGKLFDSINYQD